MATLQFTVWETAAEVALGDPIQEATVAISGTSAQTAEIASADRKRRRVRIICDTKAWVTWGEDPTAVADGSEGRMMGAENPEYFDIESGHKIAVIQRT
jgi:hypothetical protein